MAAQIKGAHRKTPAIELLRHVFVTPAVFAQAMDDKHQRARRYALSQRPVAQRQGGAVGGGDFGLLGGGHGGAFRQCF